MVVHASDPNTWEVGQKFKVLLAYIVSLKSACDIKDLISKKKKVWSCMEVMGQCLGLEVCPSIHHMGSKA